jgi:hypothetical protein
MQQNLHPDRRDPWSHQYRSRFRTKTLSTNAGPEALAETLPVVALESLLFQPTNLGLTKRLLPSPPAASPCRA